MKLAFTILGQCCSKANSRQLVQLPVRGQRGRTRIASIKSKEALKYESDGLRQIPPHCRVELRGPVGMTIRMFYGSARPDMDESLLLDILQTRRKTRRHASGRPMLDAKGKPIRDVVQKGVYVNDRQVVERHTFHAIDPGNPRVEVEVWPLELQQVSMFVDDDIDDQQDDDDDNEGAF